MQMPVHIVAAGGFVENGQGEILLVKIARDGHWVFQRTWGQVPRPVSGATHKKSGCWQKNL